MAHVAALRGDPELLKPLLDAGGAVDQLNAQRQTPLQSLSQLKQMFQPQWAALENMSKLPQIAALKDISAKLEKMLPTAEGVAECERLLREKEAE